MNNKGQSLVLFVLMVPILVGVMALVVDVGRLVQYKQKQENVLELVLQYGLDSEERTTEAITELLQKNLEDDFVKVETSPQEIVISTKGHVGGIFSSLLGFSKFSVETEYKGYLEQEKVKIEKIK